MRLLSVFSIYFKLYFIPSEIKDESHVPRGGAHPLTYDVWHRAIWYYRHRRFQCPKDLSQNATAHTLKVRAGAYHKG